MKEVSESDVNTTASKKQPGPQGIGMAVAVDWGLTVQIMLMPIVNIFFSQSTPAKNIFPTSLLGDVLSFILFWLVACIPAFFGEMLRRGHNWTLWIQITLNALLSISGIFSLVSVYHSIVAGNFWSIVTETILIIISPLIVWRLSRPRTRLWFKTVSVADARQRHGGTWVLFIALWAIIGGILQTIAASAK